MHLDKGDCENIARPRFASPAHPCSPSSFSLSLRPRSGQVSAGFDGMHRFRVAASLFGSNCLRDGQLHKIHFMVRRCTTGPPQRRVSFVEDELRVQWETREWRLEVKKLSIEPFGGTEMVAVNEV